jgi:hypothetical protein
MFLEVEVKRLKEQEHKVKGQMKNSGSLINQVLTGTQAKSFNIPALMADRFDPSYFGVSDTRPGAVVEELNDSPINKKN